MTDQDEDRGPKASDKQLKFIKVLIDKVGLEDAELTELLQEVADVDDLDDLTRADASKVIDEMHVQARERGVDVDSRPKASEKQVGFIKSLKRRAHLTDDEFTALLEEHGDVTEVEEIDRRAASSLIDELLEMSKQAQSGGGKKKKKKSTAPDAKAKAMAERVPEDESFADADDDDEDGEDPPF